MLLHLRNFLQAPKFEDPEKNSRAENLSIALNTTLILAFIFLIYALFPPLNGQVAIACVAVAFIIGLFLLLRLGRLQLVGILFSTFLWVAVFTEVIIYGGIRDSGFASFAIVLVVASLTIGIRAGIAYTALTLIAGIGLAYAEANGFLHAYVHTSVWSVILSYAITFSTVSLLLYLAIRSISRIARRALQGERTQREINVELEASHSELLKQAAGLEQRNIALQTTAEIPALSKQVKGENEFLEKSAALLADRLHLNHVNIFIINQLQEEAILRASSSEAGKALIEAGYKLKVVPGESVFSYSGIETVNFKIGNIAYSIDRPDPLPESTSSVNLPLLSIDHLLGFINIQTAARESEAFDQQAYQTFADQLALSVENYRLVNQLNERVREISLLAGRNIESGWEQLRRGKSRGYFYDQIRVMPTDESLPPEFIDDLSSGKSITYVTVGNPARSRLIAPILLREKILGIIGYEDVDPNHDWQDSEKTLLEAIASRVSLALENTRLVAEAQQRAERERNLSQVTAKIRETLDIDTILRTAVQEIKQSFNLDQTEVRLQLANQTESPRRKR